jgi:hypothetical protein
MAVNSLRDRLDGDDFAQHARDAHGYDDAAVRQLYRWLW